jgi:uncharacterized protein YeaC (DUF1315 family)
MQMGPAGVQLLHQQKEEGLQGVFKRLRRKGYQLERMLSSAQAVTQKEAEPQKTAPV